MKLDLSTVALLHNSPFLALFDWGGKAIGLVDLQILHNSHWSCRFAFPPNQQRLIFIGLTRRT